MPIAGELRERRRVEERNAEVVGFWGTVLGVGAVRRLSIADRDDDRNEFADRNEDEGDGKE